MIRNALKSTLGVFALLFLLSSQLLAQPRGFNYQAVARTSEDNQVLSEKDLNVMVDLMDGGENGTLLYREFHQVRTNLVGIFSLQIGLGNGVTNGLYNTFDEIQWQVEDVHLQISLKEATETTWNTFPAERIQAVPYALHAFSSPASDTNSGDPIVQDLVLDGTILSITNNPQATPIDLSGLAGETSPPQDLSLTGGVLKITDNPSATEIDLNTYNSATVGWERASNNVTYNEGNVGVGTVSPTGRLSVQAVDETAEEPLFMVTRQDGYPVFGVFDHGVYVYTDTADHGKGIKGGFAVGGYRAPTKGVGKEYMRVTADSIRFYVDNDPNQKGIKGGFAVGGYRAPTKAAPQDFLRVTPDSIRMYIDDDPHSKGLKGGFAVGGYRAPTKGTGSEYFNISAMQSAEVIPGENRVVWYPQRNAFLTGNVLVESPDSVGENSMASGYQSKAIGNYSEAFGYQSVARGEYSTAIGKNAVAADSNSFAFGDAAQAQSVDAYAFGKGAIAGNRGAIALGSEGYFGFPQELVHTEASGEYSLAIGLGSRARQKSSTAIGMSALASGPMSVSLGYETHSFGSASFSAGHGTLSEGNSSIAMGSFCTTTGNSSIALGSFNLAEGVSSVAMGKNVAAKGPNSVAIGYADTAFNQFSVAIGTYAKATGNYTFSAGMGTEAQSYYSTAVGANNIPQGSKTSWVPTDPIFVVGNGTSAVAADRSNAFVIQKNGNAQLYGSLTLSGAMNVGGDLIMRSIKGTYANKNVLHDHMNGNVTMSALGTNLYLGYENTKNVLFLTGTGNGSGSTRMIIDQDGNVGIGTLAANYRLEVNNSLKVGNNLILPHAIELYYNSTKKLSIGNSIQAHTGMSVSGGLSCQGLSSSSTISVNSGSNSSGIGAASIHLLAMAPSYPQFKLTEIDGMTPYEYSFRVDNHKLYFKDASGQTYMNVNQSGNIGLGISDASAASSLLSLGGSGNSGYMFSVEKSGSNNAVYIGSTQTALYVKNTGSGQKYGIYSRSGSTTSGQTSAAIAGVADRTGSGTHYSGRFYDTGSGGSYQGLHADYRTGDAIDIAEYIYDSEGTTEPGDVVIADNEKKESVLKSSKPYQTSVLGIISTQPHLTMGADLVLDPETGDPIPGVQAARLALNGRVPCKVSDENGSIEPGDLITTSSESGVAMKWSLLDVNQAEDFEELKAMLSENERRRNAVIGKAVESHLSGQGKIMVLVALQ